MMQILFSNSFEYPNSETFHVLCFGDYRVCLGGKVSIGTLLDNDD